MNDEMRRNIKLFHFYRFISRFYMYLPILIIIFLKHGLLYDEMGVAVAVHGIAILLFKMPLKKIITRIGSLNHVIFIGEMVKCLAIMLLALGKYGVWYVYLAQIISGAGFALTTSVESSLLYSLMKGVEDKSEYRRIEARSQAFSFVSVFFAGIGGSLLVEDFYMVPMYISYITTFISGITILRIKGCYMSESFEETEVNLKQDIKKMSHVLYYYACIRGAIIAVFVFVMPVCLIRVYCLDDLEFAIYLGMFSFTGYLAGNVIEKIMKITNKLWYFVPLFFVLAVLILLSKNYNILLLAPILLGFSAVIVRPLSMSYINSHIEENRSLIMSRGEQYFGLFNAVLALLFGVLVEHISILTGTICFFILVLAAMMCVALYASRNINEVKEQAAVQR